jgi:hypothetical protein
MGDETDDRINTHSGIEFAMNGTIKQVHLNIPAKGLKQRILQDQNSLICIFEEMFGHNNTPQFEQGDTRNQQSRPKISRLMDY